MQVTVICYLQKCITTFQSWDFNISNFYFLQTNSELNLNIWYIRFSPTHDYQGHSQDHIKGVLNSVDPCTVQRDSLPGKTLDHHR